MGVRSMHKTDEIRVKPGQPLCASGGARDSPFATNLWLYSTAGCALTGICCAGLPYAANLLLYIFEFAVFCFAMNPAMPYANAFAAEVDPTAAWSRPCRDRSMRARPWAAP
jgi:hypothetical protein